MPAHKSRGARTRRDTGEPTRNRKRERRTTFEVVWKQLDKAVSEALIRRGAMGSVSGWTLPAMPIDTSKPFVRKRQDPLPPEPVMKRVEPWEAVEYGKRVGLVRMQIVVSD